MEFSALANTNHVLRDIFEGVQQLGEGDEARAFDTSRMIKSSSLSSSSMMRVKRVVFARYVPGYRALINLDDDDDLAEEEDDFLNVTLSDLDLFRESPIRLLLPLFFPFVFVKPLLTTIQTLSRLAANATYDVSDSSA